MQNGMEQAITVQGIAPWMIWVWAFVGIALCAVIATVWKVVTIVRDEKKHREEEIRKIAEAECQARADKLAEEISRKIMDGIQEKFDEIDRKLRNDKEQLDKEERWLQEHEDALDRIARTLESVDANVCDLRDGFTYMARGTIASLNQLMHNGNGEEMAQAVSDMNRYLTARPMARMK